MNTRYRNVAFLLELMVNILVFSLSCAILVGLFGRAGLITRRTRQEAAAATEMLSVVETIKAHGTKGLTNATWQDDENLVCYYNESWQPTSDENAPYTLYLYVGRVQFESGELQRLQGRIEDGSGEELYALQTASYQPERGDEA